MLSYSSSVEPVFSAARPLLRERLKRVINAGGLHWYRAYTFAFISAAYFIAQNAVSQHAGSSSVFLAVVPVTAAAAFWGVRIGAPLAIAWAIANPFIADAPPEYQDHALFDYVIAGIVLGMSGVIAGRLRDQRKRLETQVQRRSIAESDMRDFAAALERRSFELSALVDLGLTATDSPDISEQWSEISAQVRGLARPDLLVIYEVFQDSNTIIPVAAEGRQQDRVSTGKRYSTKADPFKTMLTVDQGQIIGGIAFRNMKQACAGDELAAFDWAGSIVATPVYWRSELVALLVLGGRQEMRRADIIDTMFHAAVVLAGAVGTSRLYKKALHLAEELEEVNRHKDTFMSVVSHELKTPLTSIIAFSQILLRQREELSARQAQQLEAIQRGGDRLKLLIDDLLDASAIWNGKFKIIPGECDLSKIVATGCEDFRPVAQARSQRLSISLPDGPAPVWADCGRMAQVLVNLLSNASKYSPDGSDIRVEVGADYSKRNVTLSVSDEGIGISEEDQRQLFTWFFRADNEQTRAVPGTGIGLFISNTIVTNLGGRISVRSEPGDGTTFVIELPLYEPGASRKSKPGDEGGPATGAAA